LPARTSPEPRMGVSQALRVVIADDHTAYRAGLARRLRQSGIEVVGEAPDGETAVRAAAARAPDVVVLDLRLPVLSGLEATRRLVDHATQVLVLSVSAEGSDVTDAISAGASAYVLKDEPVEEVIAGIQAAASGGLRISPRVAAVLRRGVDEAIALGDDLAGGGLSTLDLQVLDLVAAGKTDDEISERLSIAAGAVRDYVRSIVTKLHVARHALRASRGDGCS
jgi:DNA-binding NarL/FixJ family response regulator